MSAFPDIWISRDVVPPAVRKGNGTWQEYVSGIWLSVPEGKAAFITKVQDDDYSLVLLGQLYEHVQPEEILYRCKAYIDSDKAYVDPAGHYIIFLRSHITKQTHVFTNRLGSYHAYWSSDRVISTRYLPLAECKKDKQPDWQGITGFMAMGYFPGDKTYLQGISVFEPASYYSFDGQMQIIAKKRYWDWRYAPIEKTGNDFTGELHDILQQSLQHATHDQNVCLPLSGGLDSRLLAGELTCYGMTYKDASALTYGYTADSPEISIARQVAKEVRLPLHAYTMPDYLFEQLDDITDAVELFQYVDGTRQASATGWLKQNVDVVVGGHWGDVWLDSRPLLDKNDLHEAFQKKIIKNGSAWLLNNICKPNLPDADTYLQDYFETFINRYDYISDATFLMKIYKTDQWSFRWTAASLRMYQAAAMPVLPFYDKRIVDLFTTIPQHMLAGRTLQVAYIKQYYPALGAITWQEYDANLYNYKSYSNRNVSYRIIDKVKRTISRKKTIQRNWEVFYLHDEGRKKLENILLSSKPLQNILPVAQVKQLLEDFYKEPSGANGYSVSMLLTFTLFLNRIYS